MFNKTYPKFGFLEVPITMTAERPDSSYKHSPQKTTKSFAKVLDTHSFVDIITQQLSNSATQQLSNSATQQLSNSATQQLSNSATQQLSN